MKRLVPVILVLVLFLVACGTKKEADSSAQSTIPENYAYSVLVTINPEVKLYMDSDSEILAVEYLNDDAQSAYADNQFIGLTLNDGIALIVETAIDKDYLKSGHDVTIEMDEVKDSTVQQQEILGSAESATLQVLEEKTFTANVVAKTADGHLVSPSQTSADSIDETTKPSDSAPSSTAPESKETPDTGTETPATKCSSCGGSGECQNCHGGRDACPACSGTGYETCPQCNGTGKDHDAPCGACGGNGSYLCTHCHGAKTAIDCPKCGGTFKCPACGGTGVQ